MQLKEQLTKIFEKKRLVIWYDRNSEFSESVRDHLPEGVELLRVENNEFGIKARIHTEKEKRFLIYSNMPKPDPQENWLLEVVVAGHEFSAEKVALWLQDLGLPDSYRAFVDMKAAFFKSEVRRKRLADLISSEDKLTEQKLALFMTSVAINTNPVMDDILLTLLKDEAEEGEKFETLRKFGLIDFVSDYLSTVFKFREKFESASSLAGFLFRSEFELHIPDAGQKTGTKIDRAPAAASFFNNWMNNNSYRESFGHFSRLFEEGNRVAEKIAAHGYAKFIDCKAPEQVEKEIVRGLALAVFNRSVKAEAISGIITTRLYFFYFNEYAHLYDALYQAALLFETVQLFPPVFTTADEGFKYYQQKGAVIDTAYRKYYTSIKGKKHESVLEKVTGLVEQVYLNNFIFNLEVAWRKALEGRERWSFPTLLMQNRFYDNYIKPFKGSEKRIFVVISDALRYEAAADLTERLRKIERFEAKIEMIAGVVPSYTQLGMAALLPNTRLGLLPGSDLVAIDGKPSAASYREGRLLEANPRSKVFSYGNFVAMPNDEGREEVKSLEVVYIYHNKIDATGDDKISEDDTFQAVEEAFKDIEQIIRKIAAFNGTNVLITADHGFYYQESKLPEQNFIDSAEYGEIEGVKRRFAFGSHLNPGERVMKFTAARLGLEGDLEFIFPTGRDSFRVAGAGSRFVHGGLSLQEVAIPVIRFNKKRISDSEPVGISIISKASNTITTNNPVFELMQSKPVSDKVREREVTMGIYAEDDTLLSDLQTHLFNLQGNDARQLVKSVKFVMRGSISQYNNKPVSLIVRDKETRSSNDPVVVEMKLFLSLPVENDFDDF